MSFPLVHKRNKITLYVTLYDIGRICFFKENDCCMAIAIWIVRMSDWEYIWVDIV